MGLVYADIELINGDDLSLVRRHMMDIDEVKRMTVNFLVNPRIPYLCINEKILEHLRLAIVDRKKVIIPNGSIVDYDIASYVEVHFKNRRTCCRALVLPGDSKPIFGTILLSDMDLIVEPCEQKLMVNPKHPHIAQIPLPGIR